MITQRRDLPIDQIAEFCRRWSIVEFALFGSILRDDFGLDSDIDVLVTFSPTTRPTLFDLVRMQAELERMLARKVDLVDRRSIERSENFIRRKHILEHAETLHVA